MTISLSHSGVANNGKQSDFYRKLESLKLLTEVNTIMDRIDRIDPMEVKAIMDRTLEPTEVQTIMDRLDEVVPYTLPDES